MTPRAPVIIGIDIGTSSTKYVVVALQNGGILERVTRSYPWSPGSPVRTTDYVHVLESVIRETQERFEIRAVAVSTQMYSLVTSDGHVIGWNAAWKTDPGRLDTIFAKLPGTGAQPDPIFPVFKLADTTGLRPYGLKAAVMQHLCGRLVVDPAEASATGLFNVHTMQWIDPVPVPGVTVQDLPDVAPHDEVAGTVRRELGFRDPFSVVPGLGDGVSASYRSAEKAETAANLGTSVAVRSLGPAPAHSGKQSREWSFRLDRDRVVTGGISRAGFGVIERFRAGGLPVACPPVQEGRGGAPLFLPWLEGIQWPLWDARQSSRLHRFGPDHGTAEIGSAVWLSIVYMVAWMMEEIGTSSSCLVAGGGVMEPGFLKVLSRCVHRTLLVPDKAEFFAAEGAALSATHALGHDISLETVITRELSPSSERDDQFTEWKEIASRSQE